MHLNEISGRRAHIQILQEVRVSRSAQKPLEHDLRARGWSAVWGLPRSWSHRQFARRSIESGGVAVLARKELAIKEMPKDALLDDTLHHGGRVAHCTDPYGRGQRYLHIFSVYGHQGASNNGFNTARSNNELLISQVLERASSLGDVPVLIGVDLNQDPATSRALQQQVAHGWWFDAGLSGHMLTDIHLRQPSARGKIGHRARLASNGHALMPF
jgi:hypothetical protein